KNPGGGPPPPPRAAPVDPEDERQQPGDVGVREDGAGPGGQGVGGEYRREQREWVCGELPAEATPSRLPVGHRRGEDSREVDGEGDQAEQDAGEERPQEGSAVAGNQAVD